MNPNLPSLCKFAALLLLSFLPSCAAPRTSQPTGFLFKATGEPVPYVVYVPRAYAASTDPYPCILFLHGSGESGADGQKQAIQGIGSAILWNARKWPFIVIMPQKPDEHRQWEDYDAGVMAALDQTLRDYRIDRSRIY